LDGDGEQTRLVEHWIGRLRAGDESARDRLLQCATGRLERLTRKMLRDYPGVGRWEQTGDVLQNASLRLCRALREVTPPTARDFFRLAALQVRRELIDLSRSYAGPEGLGANHASVAVAADSSGPTPEGPGSDLTHEPGRLDDWTEFHRAAGALPDEDREAFDLLYYQGLSQAEAAQLLDVSERTIKRRWQSARLALHHALGGRLPGA
jgi:RNA polymerase sigma-70 factor (ECF subfamily)